VHGYDEFGTWLLGIDDEKSAHTKGRYEFPCGDFVDVHRCAGLSAESRAGQYKRHDIENAAWDDRREPALADGRGYRRQ
jgi:hypothetical protein